MNCNSNTAPLLNTNMQTSCNNGCNIKDVQVICKQIIIPTGQDILGVQGESNVSERTFIIPKKTENNIDLTEANFSLLYKIGSDTQTIEIPEEDKEILENYIKIKWNIDNKVTEIYGTIQVQINATGTDKTGNEYLWKTYPATFRVIQSL